MLNKLSGWEDTIVALATPPGIGAIAVIRLSGSQALAIAHNIFPGKDLRQQASATLHFGAVKRGEEILDEVVLSIFKYPRSYTGEDVVEISCHGSPYVQQQIIDVCIEKGARLAKAGEFTQRAFLNGKLDLVQAEAVADLIASNTKASQKAALINVRGGFSAVLKELREKLIQFSALIELELDFAMEDVEFADRKQFYQLISEAQTTTQKLLASFKLGNVIKNGVSVAIIGKPNAGKSTLLNALLNEERAIVSEIAGTTRDTIEELINIKGILFRLIDTAGIREHSTDTIELTGIARSVEKMKTADAVLYIFDIKTEAVDECEKKIEEFENLQINYLLVGNKTDLAENKALQEQFSRFDNMHFISAKSNYGMEELKDALFQKTVRNEPQSESAIITNTRHVAALREVEISLADIGAGLDNSISGDLLALDIRRCLHYISEITGDISNEDVLDFIFSKFCIGK